MADYTQSSIEAKVKENPFPVESLDSKEKSEDGYGKKIAKFIYYRGIARDISTNRRTIAIENRDYANNRNDINKYKPLLDADLDNNGDTSYMTIDWSNQHPGKKFADTVIGDMINQDHKIQFNAIDKNSKAKVSKARDDFYGKIVRQRDIQEMEAASGLVVEDRGDFVPTSKEEVDIYMDMNFKQAIEIGMESIVDFELYHNAWDKKLKKRVCRDFVENNIGSVRLGFDRNNQIYLRYVDAPVDLYTSYTDEPDYDDVEYEAERRFMSIRELKRKDLNNKITQEQWFKIAKSASNKNGNGAWKFGDSYSTYASSEYGDYSFDDYRIEVLDFIFYTIDRLTYAEKQDKYGNNHLEKKAAGFELKEGSKYKDIVSTEMEMSYEGFYVVDSDIIVGYGKSKNIMRPQTEAGLTPRLLHRYIIFQPNLRGGTSKSIIEVMKPNLDTIQLLILKKRHLIAEMNPSGVAVDVTGITDVMAALKETDPMKIIKLYKQKGILFFSRTDVNGDPANGLPIQEINNPFAENLIALDQSIMAEVEQIRQNTGINDVRDGSSPDKDALVGIEKMRLLASNNTTRELYQGYLDGVLAPIGAVMARMIQYKVEYGNGLKEYDNIIGELGAKAVEFAKDITMTQLGIKIEALPTDEQVQTLLDMLNISLQQGEIRPEDVLEIKRMMNVKKAERLLIYRRKQYAEQKMLEFQQKEQITAERESSSAMAAAEAQKVKDESKRINEEQKLQTEYTLKMQLSDRESENKIKQINQEGFWKETLLEKQIREGGESKEGIDKPKILQDPFGATQRTADVTP